jgi:hypothetical protein
VARHVGAALRQLGVLRCDAFVERSGAAVLSDGVAEFKKLFEDDKLLKKGGLLFLDEAAQLSPKTDRTGAQIVNLLLKARCDAFNRFKALSCADTHNPLFYSVRRCWRTCATRWW